MDKNKIKISISVLMIVLIVVSSFAFCLTSFAEETPDDFTTDINHEYNNFFLDKTVTANDDGTYTARITTYKTLIEDAMSGGGVFPETTLTILTDMSSSMSFSSGQAGVSRLEATQTALKTLLDELNSKPNRETIARNLRINIYAFYGNTKATALKTICENSSINNISSIKSGIDSAASRFYTMAGSTPTNYALEKASEIVTREKSEGRNEVVVLLTDGLPGHSYYAWSVSDFDLYNNIANECLVHANKIKSYEKSQIYVISMFGEDGTNWDNFLPTATDDVNEDSINYAMRSFQYKKQRQALLFMNAISSNWLSANTSLFGNFNFGTSLSVPNFSSQMASVGTYNSDVTTQANSYYRPLDVASEIAEALYYSLTAGLKTVKDDSQDINIGSVFTEKLDEAFEFVPNGINFYTFDADYVDRTSLTRSFQYDEDNTDITYHVNDNLLTFTGIDFDNNKIVDKEDGSADSGKAFVIEYTFRPKDEFMGGADVNVFDTAASGVYGYDLTNSKLSDTLSVTYNSDNLVDVSISEFYLEGSNKQVTFSQACSDEFMSANAKYYYLGRWTGNSYLIDYFEDNEQWTRYWELYEKTKIDYYTTAFYDKFNSYSEEDVVKKLEELKSSLAETYYTNYNSFWLTGDEANSEEYFREGSDSVDYPRFYENRAKYLGQYNYPSTKYINDESYPYLYAEGLVLIPTHDFWDIKYDASTQYLTLNSGNPLNFKDNFSFTEDGLIDITTGYGRRLETVMNTLWNDVVECLGADRNDLYCINNFEPLSDNYTYGGVPACVYYNAPSASNGNKYVILGFGNSGSDDTRYNYGTDENVKRFPFWLTFNPYGNSIADSYGKRNQIYDKLERFMYDIVATFVKNYQKDFIARISEYARLEFESSSVIQAIDYFIEHPDVLISSKGYSSTTAISSGTEVRPTAVSYFTDDYSVNLINASGNSITLNKEYGATYSVASPCTTEIKDNSYNSDAIYNLILSENGCLYMLETASLFEDFRFETVDDFDMDYWSQLCESLDDIPYNSLNANALSDIQAEYQGYYSYSNVNPLDVYDKYYLKGQFNVGSLDLDFDVDDPFIKYLLYCTCLTKAKRISGSVFRMKEQTSDSFLKELYLETYPDLRGEGSLYQKKKDAYNYGLEPWVNEYVEINSPSALIGGKAYSNKTIGEDNKTLSELTVTDGKIKIDKTIFDGDYDWRVVDSTSQDGKQMMMSAGIEYYDLYCRYFAFVDFDVNLSATITSGDLVSTCSSSTKPIKVSAIYPVTNEFCIKENVLNNLITSEGSLDAALTKLVNENTKYSEDKSWMDDLMNDAVKDFTWLINQHASTTPDNYPTVPTALTPEEWIDYVDWENYYKNIGSSIDKSSYIDITDVMEHYSRRGIFTVTTDQREEDGYLYDVTTTEGWLWLGDSNIAGLQGGSSYVALSDMNETIIDDVKYYWLTKSSADHDKQLKYLTAEQASAQSPDAPQGYYIYVLQERWVDADNKEDWGYDYPSIRAMGKDIVRYSGTGVLYYNSTSGEQYLTKEEMIAAEGNVPYIIENNCAVLNGNCIISQYYETQYYASLEDFLNSCDGIETLYQDIPYSVGGEDERCYGCATNFVPSSETQEIEVVPTYSFTSGDEYITTTLKIGDVEDCIPYVVNDEYVTLKANTPVADTTYENIKDCPHTESVLDKIGTDITDDTTAAIDLSKLTFTTVGVTKNTIAVHAAPVKYFNITIQKSGCESEDSGQVFFMYLNDKNAGFFIDGNGQKSILLPAGTYTLHEEESGSTLYSAQTITFVVTDDGKVTIDGVQQTDNIITVTNTRKEVEDTVVRDWANNTASDSLIAGFAVDRMTHGG